MKKNVIKRGLLLLTFSSSMVFGQTTFETSESCNCTVDTVGLSAYLSTLTLEEEEPLAFAVESPTSTFAILHGVIDGTTPGVVDDFIATYPSVTTLVFMQMPGSANDEANLVASSSLYEQDYIFYLPAVNAFEDDAFIASGSVDMFLAGARRVIDLDAEVGVHSWSDGENEATDFPVGHENHQPYIDYYESIGFSTEDAEAFYYFTINAAPAAGIHLMSEAEIEQYKMRTCIYAAEPTYTVTVNENILTANLPEAEYQWVDCDNDDEPISGENNQSFIAEENGNYAVEITEDDCSGKSTCIAVSMVGVGSVAIKEFGVFPVPANDYLIVSAEDIKSQNITVFDLAGKELNTSVELDFIHSDQVKLNVETLRSGIYILKVGETRKRFNIER